MMVLALLALVLVGAEGSEPRVETRFLSPVIAAATPVTLEVTASAPADLIVSPGWPAVLGPFEILETAERRNSVEQGRRIRTWELRLLSFAAGPAKIPPIDVLVENPAGGSRRLVGSAPGEVVIEAARAPAADEPLRVSGRTLPLPWTRVDAAAAGAAVVVIALVFAGFRNRRPSRGSRLAAATNRAVDGGKVPTLEDLAAALPKNGAPLEPFYDLAARVARSATTGACGVETETLSSKELADAIAARRGQDRGSWLGWLERVDRVRYGRVAPHPSEPRELLDGLRRLVAAWNATAGDR